ncbi:hypothetical protein, partial [Enterobacter intestinihominis]
RSGGGGGRLSRPTNIHAVSFAEMFYGQDLHLLNLVLLNVPNIKINTVGYKKHTQAQNFVGCKYLL